MKFDVHKNGNGVTLILHERKLDSAIAAELKGEFLLLCKPKVGALTIDLAEVEFCDSSVLSALLIALPIIRCLSSLWPVMAIATVKGATISYMP